MNKQVSIFYLEKYENFMNKYLQEIIIKYYINNSNYLCEMCFNYYNKINLSRCDDCFILLCYKCCDEHYENRKKTFSIINPNLCNSCVSCGYIFSPINLENCNYCGNVFCQTCYNDDEKHNHNNHY